MHGCASHIIFNNLVFSSAKFQHYIFYPFHKLLSIVTLSKRISKKHFLTLTFLFFAFTILAQKKITGVITNSVNVPMVGVTVAIKNNSTGTTTDTTGNFTILANQGDVLIVSYVGYQTQEIKIDGQPILVLSLSESFINLDEIFLTGYTFQKLKEITGSVAIVKAKDLTAVPAGQVEQMLQGRVAGLNVITSWYARRWK
jgi:hypothetical protein